MAIIRQTEGFTVQTCDYCGQSGKIEAGVEWKHECKIEPLVKRLDEVEKRLSALEKR